MVSGFHFLNLVFFILCVDACFAVQKIRFTFLIIISWDSFDRSSSNLMQVNLLKKYEAERKTANVTMMAILDGFQRAYSVDFGPLNVLRAAAFHGAQYIPPLKRSIISYASGDQRLPIFS